MNICKIENCTNNSHSLGYCKHHYDKIKRHGDPFFVHKRQLCKICNEPAVAHKLCNKHYHRLRIHNDPEKTLRNMNPPEKCNIIGCNNKHEASGFCHLHYMKNYMTNRRKEVIYYYSNGSMSCNCCGENIFLFLDIDHENNNGAEHRKEQNIDPGSDTVDWIIRNNFPSGFGVLCSNCNVGKHRNGGICPHKQG
ncbi:MAG: hypothetical protein KGH87_08590 [Thaumarchaeota archaeon]|nr:hypothetical protein [Nitrososphaerota archaeon]